MESTEHDRTADADETRKEEATSTETLAEIEETQNVGSTGESTSCPTDDTAAPAPDGTPDTDRGSSADGREAGEPM